MDLWTIAKDQTFMSLESQKGKKGEEKSNWKT